MKRLLRALSVVAAGVPFAFASIRAVQTGRDIRYFWVALAGLIGAAAVVRIGRAKRSGGAVLAPTAAAFVSALVFSTLAAMMIGTRLGPGLVVVAAAFAACFAAGVWLHLQAGHTP
jgi:hypothetical protein